LMPSLLSSVCHCHTLFWALFAHPLPCPRGNNGGENRGLLCERGGGGVVSVRSRLIAN
jgi:hypothetical protein